MKADGSYDFTNSDDLRDIATRYAHKGRTLRELKKTLKEQGVTKVGMITAEQAYYFACETMGDFE